MFSTSSVRPTPHLLGENYYSLKSTHPWRMPAGKYADPSNPTASFVLNSLVLEECERTARRKYESIGQLEKNRDIRRAGAALASSSSLLTQ
jgi:hypothetical protein